MEQKKIKKAKKKKFYFPDCQITVEAENKKSALEKVKKLNKKNK